MDSLFMLSTEFAMFSKIIELKLHNRTHKYLVDLFSTDTFKPRNERESEIIIKAIGMTKFVRDSYGGISLIALNWIMFMPLTFKVLKLPLEGYYPIDRDQHFLLLYIYQYFGLLMHCCINITYDSWVASLLIFVGSQLDILAERLRQQGSFKKDIGLVGVENELKTSIHFHQDILRLAKQVEGVIKGPFTVQMGISVVVICVNFYALSFLSPLDDMIKFAGYVIYQITMMFQIFLVCYFGNLVSWKSEALSFALYEANWFEWNAESKQIMLIMFQRFTVPIKIQAIKIYVFNLTTFTSILNSSYSFFAVLRRMNN